MHTIEARLRKSRESESLPLGKNKQLQQSTSEVRNTCKLKYIRYSLLLSCLGFRFSSVQNFNKFCCACPHTRVKVSLTKETISLDLFVPKFKSSVSNVKQDFT